MFKTEITGTCLVQKLKWGGTIAVLTPSPPPPPSSSGYAPASISSFGEDSSQVLEVFGCAGIVLAEKWVNHVIFVTRYDQHCYFYIEQSIISFGQKMYFFLQI